GLVRARLRPFGDDPGQVGQGEAGGGVHTQSGLARAAVAAAAPFCIATARSSPCGYASMRIASPACAIWALASAIEYCPKWKIEAASTALAWPSRTPSTRSSRSPTPPDAITGTGTASAIERTS